MITAERLEEIWGGRLTRLDFDPVSHRCTPVVEVLDGGRSMTCRIDCEGVADLRFRNAIPDPWTYAEVTEAHLGVEATGAMVLSLMLWSEDAELVVRARHIRLQSQESSNGTAS